MKKALCFCSGIDLGRDSTESEKRFIENGGLLLEKLIGSWNGNCSPIRNFSAKELQEATNNYDSVNFLRKDYCYEWYKGSIEGRIVSIKKFHHIDHQDNVHKQAINDIVIAAQINVHNNILKLIGCCLETRFPTAVFELAENGTLYSHIHISGKTPPPQPFLWKSRLRIAAEIASAVAYLHTAFRTPIIHRDIRAANVFLDQNTVAKLSGFETSIEIPEGETHVKDHVEGNFGYIAPEYFLTSLVSEKIDVYSFGVILMELLTGRKPGVHGSDLTTYFSNEDNQVLDPIILEEVGQIDVQQQVQEMSEIALSCTETDADERPTMLDVARQLLQLSRSNH